MNDKEFEVVYKAAPENVANIVQALEKQRLHPRVLDDLRPPAGYVRAGHPYSVRIATPVSERAKVAAVLTEIVEASSPHLEAASREMWIFVFAFAVSFAVTFAISRIWYQELAFMHALGAGFLVSILTANRNRIRKHFSKSNQFLILFLIPTVLSLVLPLASTATASNPINIGSRRELFIDRHLIETMEGCKLTLARPRDEGIAFRFDQPWEGRFCGYVTVLRVSADDCRLYYRGRPEAGADGQPGERACVAVSQDEGLTWERPSLGIVEVDGRTDNNVILDEAPYCHNFSPMLDVRPGVPEDERFKALGGTVHSGLVAFASADGFHWRKLNNGESVINEGALDSQNVSFWSEAEQCYVCYLRSWSGGGFNGHRWVSRTTSEDYVHWTPIQPMRFMHNGQDAIPEHIYTNQTGPYFRAPHIYISTAARFMPGRRVLSDEQAEAIDVDPKYFGDISDGVLLTSRGGTVYDRTFMEGFIRPGMGWENWVSRTNYPALNVVPTGDNRMSLFVSVNYGQETNSLRRYSLRLDGFASVRAPYDGGVLVTKPLTFEDERLSLNFATSAAGSVRIQIETPDGDPIPGFSADECQEIIGNEIDRTVRWNGAASVAALSGTPVRLRFILQDADVYSFKFED